MRISVRILFASASLALAGMAIEFYAFADPVVTQNLGDQCPIAATLPSDAEKVYSTILTLLPDLQARAEAQAKLMAPVIQQAALPIVNSDGTSSTIDEDFKAARAAGDSEEKSKALFARAHEKVTALVSPLEQKNSAAECGPGLKKAWTDHKGNTPGYYRCVSETDSSEGPMELHQYFGVTWGELLSAGWVKRGFLSKAGLAYSPDSYLQVASIGLLAPSGQKDDGIALDAKFWFRDKFAGSQKVGTAGMVLDLAGFATEQGKAKFVQKYIEEMTEDAPICQRLVDEP